MTRVEVSVSRGERRSDLRLGAGLFLLVTGIVLATGSGHFAVQDEVSLYHMTSSLLEDGSMSVPRNVNTGGGFRGLDGRYYAPFGIGQPLLAWPLLAAARIVLPPRSEPYLECMVLLAFNAMVVGLTAVVLALFLRELGASRRRAIAGALAFALGSHAYIYGRTYFADPLTGFLGLMAVRSLWWARQGRDSHLLAAAALAGYATLVRFFSVLLLPAYALYLVIPDGRSAAARWRRALVFTGIAALFVLASLARNQILLGSWHETGYQLLPTGEVRGFTHPILPGLAILLLAPGKSLFVFAPPVLLGLVLLPRWAKRRPAEAALIVAISGIYLIGYAHWCSPEGGYSWGPRFLVPLVPLMVLPLAERAWRRWMSWALLVLTGAGLAVNLLTVPVDFAKRMAARADEVYKPGGGYNFWFVPFADHLREAARVADAIQPTPETIGRSRWHLVPEWSGEPDLWFVHLWREGHRPGRITAILVAELLMALLGAVLLRSPLREKDSTEPRPEPP